MAGFTPQMNSVYKLVFPGTELDGLEIRTKPCSIREWNEMLRGPEETVSTRRDIADGNDRMTEMFLSYTVSWNLEIPEGTPTPLTLEGFNQLGTRHGAMIISAWQRAMTEVPTNSRPELSFGDSSPEQELGLVATSESLPSWSEPS